MASRREIRAAKAVERKAVATGEWGRWERIHFPKGSVGGRGWSREIESAWRNRLYVALVREVPGGVTHLAIRTASNLEPPWRDLQRIKDELYGPDRFAVQVCPPVARLVDEADMYHLWIMPLGFEPGFGLHALDEGNPQ